MIGCCTHRSLDIDPDLDLPIDLRVVTHALQAMLQEGSSMQLHPSGSEAPWPLDRAGLAELLDPNVTAWVVQRPGCTGLVTRVVLAQGGTLLAAVAPARPPGCPEPAAWRLHLLVGLSRAA